MIFHGGSQVTCVPPPTNSTTDDDYFILFNDQESMDALLRSIDGGAEFGWKRGGSKGLNNEKNRLFVSCKKDKLNIIVTTNQKWYDDMFLASQVAAKLNLLNKEDRITLFNGIVHRKYPE